MSHEAQDDPLAQEAACVWQLPTRPVVEFTLELCVSADQIIERLGKGIRRSPSGAEIEKTRGVSPEQGRDCPAGLSPDVQGDEKCSFCLTPFWRTRSANEVEVPMAVSFLRCGHACHPTCAWGWQRRVRFSERAVGEGEDDKPCPVCRGPHEVAFTMSPEMIRIRLCADHADAGIEENFFSSFSRRFFNSFCVCFRRE